MPVVRVLTLYLNEVAELQWSLPDGRVYVERHAVPPKHVIEARLAAEAEAKAGGSQSAAAVETPPDRPV